MGWWIALGVLALLAIMPVGVSARYSGEGAEIRVIAWLIRIPLFPRKKVGKKKARPNQQKRQKTVHQAQNSQTAPASKGGSVSDFLALVRTAADFLEEFRRKLRVNRLEMKLILAGDDPCDLAVNYGKAWAALGNLMPLLENFLVIRKRNLEVECDFTAEQTRILARLDLTITVGRIISMTVRYGVRAMREYLKIMKKRKGGAEK